MVSEQQPGREHEQSANELIQAQIAQIQNRTLNSGHTRDWENVSAERKVILQILTYIGIVSLAASLYEGTADKQLISQFFAACDSWLHEVGVLKPEASLTQAISQDSFQREEYYQDFVQTEQTLKKLLK